MAKPRVFTAFDFDHDEQLRTLLVNQSRFPDSPFEMADHSVKEAMIGDWRSKVMTRIRGADVVVVMCGEYTHLATGVAEELKMAREANKPYFLLWGRSEKTCRKPLSALPTDKIYNWTWPNLKSLIGGSR